MLCIRDLLGPADELAAEVASEVQVDQPQDILLQPPAQGLDSRGIHILCIYQLVPYSQYWFDPLLKWQTTKLYKPMAYIC